MTTTKAHKETEPAKKAHKAAAKPKAAAHAAHPAAHPVEKKPRAPRKAAAHPEEKAPSMKEAAVAISEGMKTVSETPVVVTIKPTLPKDRYQFATGRRKTAIANVRMFSGKGDNLVNKKPFTKYFANPIHQNQALRPLEVTGLGTDFYFTSTINGGGINAQSQALRHGLAQALAALDDDLRKVLKKNSYLTRDDRKKERKKPGLRGARRSPQWAKR
jgi:small subunit ribosomal protein S9